MSKVAIITPVYNSQKYLKDTIESILIQTYSQWDLVLVDDGSTDNSLDICEEYAKKDKRIVVLKSKHVGVSTVRNIGLDYVRNSKKDYAYYTFIDSDDVVEKTYLESLINPLSLNPTVNIAISSYTRDEYVYDNSFETIPSNYLYKYRSEYPMPGNCNACKMFRVSLIDCMRFPDGRFHEDVFIIPKTILGEKEIIVCHFKLYYYRVVPGSTTNSGWNSKKIDRLDALEANMAYVFGNDIDAKSFFVNVYFDYLRFCICLTKEPSLRVYYKALKKRLLISLRKYRVDIVNCLGRTNIIALRHGYDNLFYRVINRFNKRK